MPTGRLIRCTATGWRWQLIPDVEVLETTNELHQQGYQVVPDDYPLAAACIAGQFCRLRRVQVPGKPTQLYAPAQALIHALAYPVVPAVSLPTDLLALLSAGAGTLILQGELPLILPPLLGRLGLLAEAGEWQVITYDILDEEAKHQQQEIERLLRVIQRNPGGEPFATFGPLCQIPGGYLTLNRHWQEVLQKRQLRFFGRVFVPLGRRSDGQEGLNNQKQVQQQLALLEQTYHQIERLESASALEKQVWQTDLEQMWPELQERVQALAAAYYRAARPGQRHLQGDSPLDRVLSLVPDLTLDHAISQPSSLRVLADPVSLTLLSALRDKHLYHLDVNGASYQTNISLPTGSLHFELSFPVGTQAECLDALGDALIDTWLVIQHQAIQATQDLSGTFTTSLDALLTMRGRQPSQKTRSLQLSQVQTLAQAQVSLWLPQLPTAREPIITPLLHLMVSANDPSSAADHLLQVGLGTWVRLIPHEIAALPRLVLDLHPRNSVAKRLGITLALYLHQYPHGIDLQMQELLQLAGISYLNKDLQNETRDRVSRAFKQLARIPVPSEDEEEAEQNGGKRSRYAYEDIIWDYHSSAGDMKAVLGQFQVKRASERIRQAIHGHQPEWFDRWLRLTWHLVPPTPPADELSALDR